MSDATVTGRLTVDLGCGAHRDPDADVGLDWYAALGVSVRADATRLPFKRNSLRGLIAHQLVEHLPLTGRAGRDPLFEFFDECHRVLVPGGRLTFDVPHVKGLHAFGDPTHRRFFVPSAFSHLWDPARDPYYPRKLWRLLWLTVTRFYPTDRHLDRRGLIGKVVDRPLRWLWEGGLGPLNDIVVTLEKP